MLLSDIPQLPDFSADGPVWKLLGAVMVALGIGLWRVAAWIAKRDDRVLTVNEQFQQKLVVEIARGNDILATQASTLATMADTQKSHGAMLDEIQKLSKEWSLLKNLPPLTVKMPDSEKHVHIEQPRPA